MSETRQNARWFLGRRSYTSVSDRTEAEWSSYVRNVHARSRLDRNLTIFAAILLSILLPVMCYAVIRENGLTFEAIWGMLPMLLMLAWLFLYLRRYFSKR